MTNHETTWDQRLHITTVGRDDSNSDTYRYPYEPTPYSVLERMASSGFFCENDVVLDYGCGKGRVSFFLSHQTKAKAIGIEYDDHIYAVAQKNQISAQTAATFCLANAEAYSVPQDVNRCYFFNPFSVEILQKVMARIIESYYENPREIFLFFYYPSDDFLSCLMTVDELEFYDEIECDDLFADSDPRERIMIFQLPDYASAE